MSKQASGMRGLNIDMMQQICDEKMLTELAKLRSHADADTFSSQQNGVHGPDPARCLEVARLRKQRDLAQTENEVLKGQIEELARILEREKDETIAAQNSEKKALSESIIAAGQLRVMREELMNSTSDSHHHYTARIEGADDDDLLRSQCIALKERLADVEMSRYRQREKSESMRLELGKAKWEILRERETQKQQQQRIQKLEGELFILKSEAIQLQEQAHEHRKTLDETRDRLKMKEEHISKHRLECERLQHELNAQTQAVEDAVEAKAIVLVALEEKKSELGESKREHDILQESLEEELKQAVDENSRLHAIVKTLESRVDELDAILSVEKEDKASARRQVQALTTQRDEAKRHASEVAANLDQVTDELRQTKMDLENLQGQVAQMQKQNYEDEKQQSENTAHEVSKLRQELALANAIIAEKDDLLLTLHTQHQESCEALCTEREQYNAAQRLGDRMQQNYEQALAEIEHLQDQHVNSPRKHDHLHVGSAYTAPEYDPSRSRSASPVKSPERTHLSCGIGLTLAPRILHDGTLRCKVVGINADGGAFEAGLINTGDEIVSLDNVKPTSTRQLIDLSHGEIGTELTLVMVNNETGAGFPYTVKVRRKPFDMKQTTHFRESGDASVGWCHSPICPERLVRQPAANTESRWSAPSSPYAGSSTQPPQMARSLTPEKPPSPQLLRSVSERRADRQDVKKQHFLATPSLTAPKAVSWTENSPRLSPSKQKWRLEATEHLA